MIRIIKKVSDFLTPQEKGKMIWIFVLMVIAALLDMFSVSMMVPLVNAIFEPDFFANNEIARWICAILNISSSESFIMILLVGIIFLFLGKAFLVLLQTYFETKLSLQIRLERRQSIMNKMMKLPYEFFSSQNSENIRRTLTTDLDSCFDMVSSLLSFFTQAFSILAVVVVVVTVDWQMALIVSLVLCIEFIILSKIVKPIIFKLGQIQREISVEVNLWLIQSITGIKEILAADNQNFFVNKSKSALTKQMKAMLNNTVVQKIPPLILESGTICFVILIIIIFVICGGNITDLAPQLTAFAVAALKLIPAAKQISQAQNTLVYKEPCLNAIFEVSNYLEENCCEKNELGDEVITCTQGFGFENLSFKYADSEVNVLENVCVSFKVGETIGIKGVSGGGKTTLLDLLLGLLHPQQGKVYSDGKNILENPRGWRSLISYIPQSIYLLDDSIKANICFGMPLEDVDEKRLDRAIKEASLEELINQLPDGVNTKIGERGAKLSGGQRQRIGIARALYREAEILILDEATSALDTQTEREVMDSINSLRGKKTLIIVAHRLSTLEQCDTIYEIKDKAMVKVN